MKNLTKLIAIAFISLAPSLSYAAVSGAVTITQVRPLASWPPATSANEVYFYTSPAAFCSKNNFRIDLTVLGGKETYAVLLVAVATGKRVTLEIADNSNCNADWNLVHSIGIIAD